MNIININSNIEITPSQKSFIEEVLICGDDHPAMEMDSFYWLSKEIPIFLINEKSMEKYDAKNEYKYKYEPNLETKPCTEWLGFYERDSSGLFEHTPIIAICPERIAKCVQNDEEFMFLLAKVIVHELAHAKMDSKDQNIRYRKKDEFWHWMEESSANRYTLEVFENFTNTCRYNNQSLPFRNKSWKDALFNFVEDFIKSQPPEYALGYELYKKSPVLDWEWERYKDELGGQKRAIEKKEWLDYMKKNYKSIDEDKSTLLFDAVFNGKQKSIENYAKKRLEEKIQENDPSITQKDLQNVTDMSSLFHGVKNLKADITKWDVSKVTNMSHMFKFSSINQDISNWDVSNVTDMRYMFDCAKIDIYPIISKWKFNKNVNLEGFAEGINSLEDIEKLKKQQDLAKNN